MIIYSLVTLLYQYNFKMVSIYEVEKNINKNTPGIEYCFSTTWIMWIQNQCDKWMQESTRAIAKFNTIAGFWSLINNINLSEKKRFIFMRDGIKPNWEDPKHKYGGYCFINLNNEQSEYIFLQCLLGIIGETFTTNNYDSFNITGITYLNDKRQIKIWISNSSNALITKNISQEYLNILSGVINNLSVPRIIPYKKLYYKITFISFANIIKNKKIM